MPKKETVRKFQQVPPGTVVPVVQVTATTAVGDADTVDGFHASAAALPNTLLALNSSSKLPASITGDADTVDGYEGSELAALAENETVSGAWTFSDNVTIGSGKTVDGVDISAHAADADAHHNQAHAITGADHTVTGSQWALVGLTGADTLGLLTPSADVSAPAEAILKSTSGGKLTLADFATTEVSSNLIPSATDTYDLGSSSKLWRKGWLSELDAIVFALNTITLLGGWFMIPKYAGGVAEDVDNSETQIDFGFSDSVGAANDFVIFRSVGKVEYMQLTSFVSGTTWNVTRDMDGSGANTWPQGAPFALLGYDGDGRIEMLAYDTGSHTGVPRINIYEQGTSYNSQTEVARFGNMNGAYDVDGDYYGIGLGDYSEGNYLKYDSNGGFELRAGGGTTIIDADGSAIEVSTNFLNTRSYRFLNTSGTLIGRLTAYDNLTTQHHVNLECESIAGMASYAALVAWGPASGTARAKISADTGTASVSVAAYVNAGVPLVQLNGDTYVGTSFGLVVGAYTGSPAAGDVFAIGDIRVGGGLYVGSTATDPDADTIICDGDTRVGGGLVVGDVSLSAVSGNIKIPDGQSTPAQWTFGTANTLSGMRLRCLTDPTTSPYYMFDVRDVGYESMFNVKLDRPVYTPFGMVIGGSPGDDFSDYGSTMSRGIIINQGSADDHIMEFHSTDVAHGMTDILNTTGFAYMTKMDGAAGGLAIHGLRDSSGAANRALQLHGVLGETPESSRSTSNYGVTNIVGSKISGTTAQAVGSSENAISWGTWTTTRMIMTGDGNLYLDAATNDGDWDEYDDLGLMETLRSDIRLGFRQRTNQMLQEHREILERTGVVEYNDQGEMWMSVQGMGLFTMDTLLQFAKVVLQKLEAAERRLAQLEA